MLWQDRSNIDRTVLNYRFNGYFQRESIPANDNNNSEDCYSTQLSSANGLLLIRVERLNVRDTSLFEGGIWI